MAETDFGALPNLRKKLWSANVWSFARDQLFWSKAGMIGKGVADDAAIVHYVDELTATERGDKAVMALVPELQGDGVAGDLELEGNEEGLTADDITITIDQIRHAVKSKGRVSEQKTVIRFRAYSKSKLGNWLADRVDEMAFLTISGVPYTQNLDGSARVGTKGISKLAFANDVTAPSSLRTFYAGPATNLSGLTAADTMSWNRIVEIRSEAVRRKLRPIRQGGKDYYVLLMHTYQLRDLAKDPTYQSAAAQAEKPGSDNPLWNGAKKIVDGVMLYEHNRTYNSLGMASGSKAGASGTVDYAQSLLLGNQALGFAAIGDTYYNEKSNIDYDNKAAVSVGRMLGFVKPIFQRPEEGSDQDFGVMSLYTAAAPIN